MKQSMSRSTKKRRAAEAQCPHDDIFDVIGSQQRFRQAHLLNQPKHIGNARSNVPEALKTFISSSEEPIDNAVQPNRGDDYLYKEWMRRFNIKNSAVELMMRSRTHKYTSNSSSSKIPWTSTSNRAADHPELFSNMTTRDASGDAGIERSLLLSDHVKQYKHRMLGGTLVWAEDFEMKMNQDACLIAQESLRAVPTILRQAVRQHINATLLDGDFSASASLINLGPIIGSPEQIHSLKCQALEVALGRHAEGLADAALTMVTQYFVPYYAAVRKLATKETIHRDRQDALEHIFEDTEQQRVENPPKPGEARSRRQKWIIPDATENPATAKFIIGWEHVLRAVQDNTDDLIRQDKSSLRVREDLPALHLTPEVIRRFHSRLVATFGQPPRTRAGLK